MSKYLVIFLFFALAMGIQPATAQCSICTRTAQQLGERPAKALNKGIIYLAFTPLAIFFVIGYRWARSEGHGWWKSEDHD
ncbi:MAG TPA: hypothetical protein VGQ51_11465 [Puia sp.]|jgi:hypothetical protein|nr:hypothetical protein [Puia sp.]